LKPLEDKDINCCKINVELETPFTKAEYDIALNSIKLKTASGLDQIDYNIISFLPDSSFAFTDI